MSLRQRMSTEEDECILPDTISFISSGKRILSNFSQHFSSQAKDFEGSCRDSFRHASTQDLQVSNSWVVTIRQVPSLSISQCANCRHLSPSWYTAVQTSGISGPHAMSRPWQGVSPQSGLPWFPVVIVAGIVVGVGVPSGTWVVHPEPRNMTTRTKIHITGMKNCLVKLTSLFLQWRILPLK